jgi:hypothetical protein
MKKEDIKIKVTLGDIMDAPLIGSWTYICEKYGINEWCLNEGRAEKEDTIEISLNDAEYIGLIEK